MGRTRKLPNTQPPGHVRTGWPSLIRAYFYLTAHSNHSTCQNRPLMSVSAARTNICPPSGTGQRIGKQWPFYHRRRLSSVVRLIDAHDPHNTRRPRKSNRRWQIFCEIRNLLHTTKLAKLGGWQIRPNSSKKKSVSNPPDKRPVTLPSVAKYSPNDR